MSHPPSSASSSPAPSSHAPACTVSHRSALQELQDMFPMLDRDIIIFTLNENGRQLERTIFALLPLAESACDDFKQQHDPHNNTQQHDAALAIHMQEEADRIMAEKLQNQLNMSSSTLDPAELERLQLAQFHHRAQIYQSNNEGRFGASKHVDLLKTQYENYRKSLTPAARQAEDERRRQILSRNRVANSEEISLAATSSKKFDKYTKQKALEQQQAHQALSTLNALGYNVTAASASSSSSSSHATPPRTTAGGYTQLSSHTHDEMGVQMTEGKDAEEAREKEKKKKKKHDKEKEREKDKEKDGKEKDKKDKDKKKSKKNSKKKKKHDSSSDPVAGAGPPASSSSSSHAPGVERHTDAHEHEISTTAQHSTIHSTHSSEIRPLLS